jgi:acetyltransferase
MSHETLTRYCNLDYDREVAIVAELADRRIIGVSRLILEPNGKNCEFAILIGDAWQSKKLGSRLMKTIIEVAKDMKLGKIYGYVMTDNEKMLNMCRKLGFNIEPFDEETIKAVMNFP